MKKFYTLLIAALLWPALMFAQNGEDCDNAVLAVDGANTVLDLTGTGGSDGGAAAWFMYTPAEGGTINIATCDQGVDTEFEVFDGTCAATNQIASGSDNCATGNGNNWAAAVYDVPVLGGTTYYIEFHDQYSTDGFDFEFSFVPTPTCSDISGLVASDIMDTEVTFNWNPDGNTSWDYAVDVEGFDIGAATITNTADTFATASALLSGIFYDVYVRTNCGSETGAWEMITVRTVGEGDNCVLPYVVDLDADLPYSDLGNNTCGRGVPYNGSCMGFYDGGESIVYRLDVTTAMTIKIVMDPNGTSYTGLGLFDDCPDVGACIDTQTGSSSVPREIIAAVDAGVYYVMASTWPSPTCIPVMDLTIEQLLCDDVSGLALSSLSDMDAEMNWNSDGNTDWDYAFAEDGMPLDTAAPMATTDTFYVASALMAETTYNFYVRTNCGSELGNWSSLTFTTPMTPINGDSCVEASVITAGTHQVSDLIGTGATATNADAAAWFEYTPDMNGSIDVYSCYGGSDTRVWVWSGDCDGLVEEGTNDDACLFMPDSSGFAYASALYGINVTAGTTYLIEWDDRWSNDPFVWNLDFSEEVIEYPVNDTCGGAQITDVEVGVVASAMGDATNGTIDNGFPVAQVWEAFTLSECADVVIDFCGSSPLATALYINIYNSCPIGTSLPTGTVTLIECAGNDSALSVSFVGLEAGTYWYPVLADIDNYGGFGAYTINYTATACPAPQPLETCELSEEVLAPSATSNAGLTGSGGSQGGAAAWYHYTPAEDGFIDVSSCLGGSDTRLWIWEGDCDNLVAVADTDDDCAFAPDGTGFEYAASLDNVPVVGGTTYYIEWDATWSAAAFDWTLNFSTTTGIEDNEIADFAIYPNPNNGQFSIVNDGVNGTYLIEIMDVTGKVVYSEQLQLNANETTVINATDVNTGVYLVKTTNTEENYYRTIRMVIK